MHYIDLSSSSKLAELQVRRCNFEVLADARYIEKLILEQYDLSVGRLGRLVETLSLAQSLKIVAFYQCTLKTDNENSLSYLHNFDLAACSELKELDVKDCNFVVSADATHLKRLVLENYDLSVGILKSTLPLAQSIETLSVVNCKITGTDNNLTSVHCIDLLLCSSVVVLIVRKCNFIVSAQLTNLKQLILENYDLSVGRLASTLPAAKSLEKIGLHHCKYYTNNDKGRTFFHCIDLTCSLELAELHVENCNFVVSVKAGHLKKVVLNNYDLSVGDLSSTIRSAKVLDVVTLFNCKSKERNNDCSSLEGRYFTFSSKLAELNVMNCNFVVSADPTKLKKMILARYDLSAGKVASILSFAEALESIVLFDCNMSVENDGSVPCLNLTSSSNLSELYVRNCNFVVSANALLLKRLELGEYDLSDVRTARLLSSASSLETVIFNRCQVSNQMNKVGSDVHCVDLTTCKELKTIDVLSCKLMDFTFNSQLTRLVLCDYEIRSKSMVLQITSAQLLTEVAFLDCRLTAEVADRNAVDYRIDLSRCDRLTSISVMDCNFAVYIKLKNLQYLTLGIANILTRETADVIEILRNVSSLKVLILVGCREINQITRKVFASDQSLCTDWKVAVNTFFPSLITLHIKTNELQIKEIHLSNCKHLKELFLLKSNFSACFKVDLLKHAKILRFDPTQPYIYKMLQIGKEIGDLSLDDMNKETQNNPNRVFPSCADQKNVECLTTENQSLLKVDVSRIANKIVCRYLQTKYNSDSSCLLTEYTRDNCVIQKISNVEAEILRSYLSNPLNLVEVTVGTQHGQILEERYDKESTEPLLKLPKHDP